MELTENDKYIIETINSNNIDKISALYFLISTDLSFNIHNFFKKERISLFDKNAKFLNYFRGWYYIGINNKKAKILMKYNNPFILLFNDFSKLYYNSKIKKAIYYLKKNKYNILERLWSHDMLNSYYLNEHKYKYLYYYLCDQYLSKFDKKKYFINIIFMKI